MYDIWNNPDDIVLNEFSKPNYRIIRYQNCSGKCVIYFSSNGIWFPNEKGIFIDTIVNSNRYEWSNTRISDVEKEIFVRDIYKSWYVRGINLKLNTIDEILKFLKKETNGFEVVTIGASAGGYMAALTAAYLNNCRAICFSAQFDLWSKDALGKSPFLQQYKNIPQYNQYYSIISQIEKSNSNIYYFCPLRNRQDFSQYKLVSNIDNVFVLKFRSKRHGVLIPSNCLKQVINLDALNMHRLFKKYEDRTISPIAFCIHLSGVKKTIQGFGQLIYCKKFKKK